MPEKTEAVRFVCLCFLPLMIRAVIPALCFGNILFPLAECGALAAKNISERRKEKLHLPRHYAPLYLRSASEAVFRGQTAPKAGITSHSKNKMAPHPVKKNSAKEPFFLGAVFLYAPNPASISRIPRRLTLLRSSGYTPPAPILRSSRRPSAPPTRFGRSTDCVPAGPAPTGCRRPSADPKWDRENA